MTTDLNAAIEAVKAEAYQQGWDDCADAILKAARAGKAPKRGKGPRRTPAVEATPAPSAEALNRAGEAGHAHGRAGESRMDNPHPRGSELAQAWDDRWVVGEAEFVKEVGG